MSLLLDSALPIVKPIVKSITKQKRGKLAKTTKQARKG